jgi:hypothetical protein
MIGEALKVGQVITKVTLASFASRRCKLHGLARELLVKVACISFGSHLRLERGRDLMEKKGKVKDGPCQGQNGVPHRVLEMSGNDGRLGCFRLKK